MKYKLIIFVVVFLSIFSFGITTVEAQTVHSFEESEEQLPIAEGSQVSNDCGGIFTEDALNIIQECLGYFRILAPAVLIVMIAVDLFQVITSAEYMPGGKDDSVRKATQRIFRRILAAVLLFFVPTIVSILLNLDGVKDTLEIPEDCINVIK